MPPRQRHNSNPEKGSTDGASLKRDPINLNAELDTVSERSEIEEDPTLSESLKKGTYFVFILKFTYDRIIWSLNNSYVVQVSKKHTYTLNFAMNDKINKM